MVVNITHGQTDTHGAVVVERTLRLRIPDDRKCAVTNRALETLCAKVAIDRGRRDRHMVI